MVSVKLGDLVMWLLHDEMLVMDLEVLQMMTLGMALEQMIQGNGFVAVEVVLETLLSVVWLETVSQYNLSMEMEQSLASWLEKLGCVD